MAASNQARALLGWSNTAVSETSSWAMENDQEKPARRSSLVRGSGITANMRSRSPRRCPEPSAGASAAGKSRVVYGAQAVVQSV